MVQSGERLQNFLSHLNNLQSSIPFTMEMVSDGEIPFLGGLVIRKEMTMATKVYRKPTHTGRYLSFKANHPPHVKIGLIQSIHTQAFTICQELQDPVNEISNLRHDFQLNAYPHGFIDPVINSKGSSHSNKKEKPLGSVNIPYVTSVSEKFKRIGNPHNIRSIFRTKHTLRSSLMKARLERDLQQMALCVYSIHCECGRNYIGETGRPLAVQIREHRHNQKGLLENQN
jgi:hypothetical protein